jgi:hypothetical protein
MRQTGHYERMSPSLSDRYRDRSERFLHFRIVSMFALGLILNACSSTSSATRDSSKRVPTTPTTAAQSTTTIGSTVPATAGVSPPSASRLCDLVTVVSAKLFHGQTGQPRPMSNSVLSRCDVNVGDGASPDTEPYTTVSLRLAVDPLFFEVKDAKAVGTPSGCVRREGSAGALREAIYCAGTAGVSGRIIAVNGPHWQVVLSSGDFPDDSMRSAQVTENQMFDDLTSALLKR